MIGTTILIVDDHRLFADVVASALEQMGARIVGPVGNAADAIVAVAAERPDVVLLDLSLPDGDGIDAGRTIVEEHPATIVLALSASTDPTAATEAMKAGFRGFVPKDAPFSTVVDAIRTALNGQSVVIAPKHTKPTSATTRGGVSAALLASGLTVREREVLELLVAGLGSGAMAEKLQISTNTVRTHVQSVLTKLQVHSRLEAAAFAVRHELVEPGRASGISA